MGYAQRNFLVPLPRVASLTELSALLPGQPGRSAPGARPDEGRGLGRGKLASATLALHSWPCYLTGRGKANLPSLGSFDGKRYSVLASDVGATS